MGQSAWILMLVAHNLWVSYLCLKFSLIVRKVPVEPGTSITTSLDLLLSTEGCVFNLFQIFRSRMKRWESHEIVSLKYLMTENDCWRVSKSLQQAFLWLNQMVLSWFYLILRRIETFRYVWSEWPTLFLAPHTAVWKFQIHDVVQLSALRIWLQGQCLTLKNTISHLMQHSYSFTYLFSRKVTSLHFFVYHAPSFTNSGFR